MALTERTICIRSRLNYEMVIQICVSDAEATCENLGLPRKGLNEMPTATTNIAVKTAMSTTENM